MQMVTRTEIIAMYPGIEHELLRVEQWFDVPLRFALRRDPTVLYFPPVKDAFDVYTSDESARRIQKIIFMTEKMSNVPHSGPWPIFLYAEDDFLLEGWHRLVAFRMLGLPEVDVVMVERDAPPVDPTGFDPSDIVIVEKDWHLSAMWRGCQIGHVRINDTILPGEGRHVDSTFVLPAFRRRGVASLLYDAAERSLAAQGMTLVPSPASALSVDAAALWAKREALKQSG